MLDQSMPIGTGAFPSFDNSTTGDAGGPGYKFIKIKVQGQPNNGIHFKVLVFGNLTIDSESSSSNHHEN